MKASPVTYAEPDRLVGDDLEARSKGLSKSAISSRFVKATKAALAECRRDPSVRARRAKALAARVKKVFDDQAKVQRCTLHKRRNVVGHPGKQLGRTVDKRLPASPGQPFGSYGPRVRSGSSLNQRWPP